ncbi:MAG: hypothetical protein IPK76_07045 [Lewinellaceae bacterium]|nr:hypothetical protein [Lewinellaceae bacterium]
MITKQNGSSVHFHRSTDNGVFHAFWKRLKGPPPACAAKAGKLSGNLTLSVGWQWSINKESATRSIWCRPGGRTRALEIIGHQKQLLAPTDQPKT